MLLTFLLINLIKK